MNGWTYDTWQLYMGVRDDYGPATREFRPCVGRVMKDNYDMGTGLGGDGVFCV